MFLDFKDWMNQLAHWIKVFSNWVIVLTKVAVTSGTVDFAHRDVPSSRATYSCVAWFCALERIPGDTAVFPYHCHSVVGGSRTLKRIDIDHWWLFRIPKRPHTKHPFVIKVVSAINNCVWIKPSELLVQICTQQTLCIVTIESRITTQTFQFLSIIYTNKYLSTPADICYRTALRLPKLAVLNEQWMEKRNQLEKLQITWITLNSFEKILLFHTKYTAK